MQSCLGWKVLILWEGSYFPDNENFSYRSYGRMGYKMIAEVTLHRSWNLPELSKIYHPILNFCASGKNPGIGILILNGHPVHILQI